MFRKKVEEGSRKGFERRNNREGLRREDNAKAIHCI